MTGPTLSSKKRSSVKAGTSSTMLGRNCSLETKKSWRPSGCRSWQRLRTSSTELLLMIWNAASVVKVLRKSSLRSKINLFGLSLVLRLRGDLIAMTSLSIATENHWQTVSLKVYPKYPRWHSTYGPVLSGSSSKSIERLSGRFLARNLSGSTVVIVTTLPRRTYRRQHMTWCLFDVTIALSSFWARRISRSYFAPCMPRSI